jgi:hypothetical protein
VNFAGTIFKKISYYFFFLTLKLEYRRNPELLTELRYDTYGQRYLNL